MNPFDALGSQVRRDILQALVLGPLTVGELAEKFPVSRPAISRHLKVLHDAGLVQLKEVDTRNIYSVRSQGFELVQEFLNVFWSSSLSRMKELAEE